ncbi:hypothetical protein DAPPUDRAFT_315444 [Daphnia pulex]|uniref:Uncharacterized protein n=1 Tax=Daphnia pulex TaxID=6669 RepID=E9G9S3_DAPPU|nr:hypothetical protein DAPPUDRAFT_315444 [Daphnia pulex]|eukprot:EFX83836.1 hypothetical protein DAPPUDRAFT_315444 [Daphnia pulex]
MGVCRSVGAAELCCSGLFSHWIEPIVSWDFGWGYPATTFVIVAGTQVTLTFLKKTPVIANNKPLSSSPVSKNNDDVEICSDSDDEDLNEELALISDSGALENDPLGDEERPRSSFGLPKPQLKKTGFPETVMQPKSVQNNKDYHKGRTTITQVPDETKFLPEVSTDPVYSDWLAYCSTYAKRVASITDVGKRDDIRYKIEGILYQHLKSFNANKTTFTPVCYGMQSASHIRLFTRFPKFSQVDSLRFVYFGVLILTSAQQLASKRKAKMKDQKLAAELDEFRFEEDAKI